MTISGASLVELDSRSDNLTPALIKDEGGGRAADDEVGTAKKKGKRNKKKTTISCNYVPLCVSFIPGTSTLGLNLRCNIFDHRDLPL